VFLFIHYFGVRKLEGFFATLIFIVGVCFITNMFKSDLDPLKIFYGWALPIVPPGSVPAMLGLVGTVIMPHNLHLHSALVITRKVNIKNRTHVNEAIMYNIMDSSISIITFFINGAVICTFAAYVI
jgi:NRAMP (natural resistance-associated macrophage protein)-like metal ion transporter